MTDEERRRLAAAVVLEIRRHPTETPHNQVVECVDIVLRDALKREKARAREREWMGEPPATLALQTLDNLQNYIDRKCAELQDDIDAVRHGCSGRLGLLEDSIPKLGRQMEAAERIRKLESAQSEQPDDVLDAIPDVQWDNLWHELRRSNGPCTTRLRIEEFIRKHVLKGGK